MGKIDDLLSGKQDDALADVTGEDALKHLVGEGQKYATVEDMAKGMLNGQVHIGKLEKENSTFRDATTQAKGIDDILAALNGKKTNEDDDNHQHQDHDDKGDSAKLSVEDQIAAAFTKRDDDAVKVKEDANLNSTVDELSKLYGDKALETFNKVGKDLGIDLEALAKKSPAAVMKLVSEARPAEQTSGLPQSTQMNTTTQVNGGVMNQAAIGKLYKEGKLNRDQKITLENQMFTQLGSDKFYNRN